MVVTGQRFEILLHRVLVFLIHFYFPVLDGNGFVGLGELSLEPLFVDFFGLFGLHAEDVRWFYFNIKGLIKFLFLNAKAHLIVLLLFLNIFLRKHTRSFVFLLLSIELEL